MSNQYAETSVDDTNACATAAAAVAADERPTHTVRVTLDGIEIDGAILHPETWDIVSRGPRSGALRLYFENLVDAPEPKADMVAAPAPEPESARGYVQLLIKTRTPQDGARQVSEFCARLPDSIKVNAEVQICR